MLFGHRRPSNILTNCGSRDTSTRRRRIRDGPAPVSLHGVAGAFARRAFALQADRSRTIAISARAAIGTERRTLHKARASWIVQG
jgi:hypothetical protein